MREANDSRFNLNILPHCKQRQVVAACQKALLGRGQRAYIMLPSPPRNITFQRPVTTAGTYTAMLLLYVPRHSSSRGQALPFTPAFFTKNSLLSCTGWRFAILCPFGWFRFCLGQSWYYPGCGRAGLQPDGAFLQSGSPCRWCQCALQSPGGWPRGQRPGRRQPSKHSRMHLWSGSPPEWRGHPAQRCSKWWF